MFLLSTSILVVYAGLYLVLTRSKKSNLSDENNLLKLKDISIIIPFRNEETKLPKLIADLNTQNGAVNNIFFVDDHSTDKSVAILRKELEKSTLKYSIIQLKKEFGKKAAIAIGVHKAESKFILQLDADVELSQKYFKGLQSLKEKDLIVLPVLIKKSNIWLKMFELDFLFFHAFNFKMRKHEVLTASGANLLYKKESYIEAIEKTKGKKYLSGDDYFLLEQMKQLNMIIGVESNIDVCVESSLPSTFLSCLQQRLRWLSKSETRDVLAMFFLFVLQIFSLYSLFAFQTYYLGLFFYFFKSLIDIALVYEYIKRLNRRSYLIYVPLFFGTLPLYFLLLVIASFFVSKSWKGRPLKQK